MGTEQRRLTIETVKPGMKVFCVDPDNTGLREGKVYVVERACSGRPELFLRGEYSGSYRPDRFIPADPEPAPSLAAAIESAWRKAVNDLALGSFKVSQSSPSQIMNLNFDAMRDQIIADAVRIAGEPAPSWATEELREALVEWHRTRGAFSLKDRATDDLFYLLFRLRGLHPRAPASTTLPAMYLGADAFEEQSP